jgi:hypothetical protein
MVDNGTPGNDLVPKALLFSLKDLFKVLWELLFAFSRTYTVQPGLYFTGKEYDISAPLLVTANYHLTVWSVWRRIRNLKTRILIIDTDGINVWCSAGKGRFCAEEIIKQINRYPHEILSKEKNIQLILPKLSLSGVKLADLRANNISPIIGPVYAGDLPLYLQNKPLADSKTELFTFDIADRLFTLPSSVVQITLYSVIGAIVLSILNFWLKTGFWWQIIPLSLTISTAYILLFPLLPTRSFVYKGIILSLLVGAGYLFYNSPLQPGMWQNLFYLSYIAGFSIFFGLYYTGNSGVSNYSIVKKETVLFLPVVVLLFLAALAGVILKGVLA